jgi:hypothetical protein
MKNTVSTIFFVLLGTSAFAQGGLAFFSSGREVAISTNFEKKFWGEFRLNTKSYNSVFEDLLEPTPIGIPQVAGHFNIYANRQMAMSLGLSVGYNPAREFGVIGLPLGVRTAPFAKAPNFYLAGEFTLKYFNGEEITPYVSWGMRYQFLKE